jgi:hypothetical protein
MLGASGASHDFDVPMRHPTNVRTNTRDDIVPNETIAGVLSRHFRTARVFVMHRMHYIGCAIAPFETIEEACAYTAFQLNDFSRNSMQEKHGGGQHMTMTTSTMATLTDGASRGSTEPSGSGVIRRIEAEYREMPGLRLTLPQASRLWGLNVGQSERLLSELVDEGFLMRDMSGAYRRRGCPRCS